MEKEEIVKYLVEKGYPVSTGGDIPTYEQSMQAMTELYNYQKNSWIEKACDWLDYYANTPYISYTDKEEIISDFKKYMEE